MKNKRYFLIKESLKKKLKSKWFIGINIFAGLLILILINIASIVAFFGGDFKQSKNIIVLDTLDVYDEFANNFQRNSSYSTIEFTLEQSNDSLEVLKDRVKTNNNNILLVINYDENNYINADMYTNNGLSNIYTSIINQALNNIKYNIAINDIGISKEDMARINTGVTINSKLLMEENKPSENNNKKTGGYDIMGAVVVIAFILPFFFLIVTLVQMIGAEINEEKTNKSMEIIISNVSAKDHLISKIISCTTFIIIQVIMFGLFILIANLIKNNTPQVMTDTGALLRNAFSGLVTPEIISMILRILPILAVFFILTLITYALLAGVLASMTTNIDDFQQLQTPLMLIVSIGLYLGIIAVIFEGSTFIKIMSYIPLVSFLLSPSLYMLNQVSIISVIISTIIQGIFMIIVYKYGMKIYKVGILNYSGTHLWKKIYKALKK